MQPQADPRPKTRPSLPTRSRAWILTIAVATILVMVPFTTMAARGNGGNSNEPPTAVFTYACVELDCSFDAGGSTDPDGPSHRLSYAWDFGDGASATGSTPSHSYAASGVYAVVLTVTDQKGGTGTDTQDVAVSAPPSNTPPTTSFTHACSDLACDFDASASTDAEDGNPKSYAWDFGDGANAVGVQASHAYAAAGTYTVTLTVADSQGAEDTETRDVTVSEPPPPNQPPTASFSFTCTDLSCDFDGTASSDPEDGTPTSYAWDFGDGANADGAQASHAYPSAGTYNVILTVADSQGLEGSESRDVTVSDPPPPPNQPPVASFTFSCIDLHCEFDGTGSSDPEDGAASSFAWDFGDGGGATGAMASHSYAATGTYTVALTVTDSGGLTGSDAQEVTVSDPPPTNQPPAASFTYGCTDLDCTFDGSASTDPEDGTPVSYAWDFGDGTTGQGPIVAHSYGAGGTFTVTLTVSDSGGLENSTSQDVSVTAPPPPNTPPEAAFTYYCAGLVCAFDASDSSDAETPDDELVYSWLFGDGTKEHGPMRTAHAYKEPRWYRVDLWVHDGDGGSDSVSLNIRLPTTEPTNHNTRPVADYNHYPFYWGYDFYFSSSPTVDLQDADDEMSYHWDFGDGATSTDSHEFHYFANPGFYNVTLTVTDTGGLTDRKTKSIEVEDIPPDASRFGVECDSTLLCDFTSSGRDYPDPPSALAYAWDFGDGTQATGRSVSHRFSVVGTYEITHTLTDSSGQSDTATRTLSVTNYPPVAAFAVECTELSCSFDASYSWDREDDDASLRYSWDMGDGTFASGMTVAHTFAVQGEYNVSLVVEDKSGQSRGTVRTVVVPPPPPGKPPDGRASVVCDGLQCIFNASATTDPDEPTGSLLFSWDFGDGTTGVGMLANHTYAKKGLYRWELSVTDSTGRSDPWPPAGTVRVRDTDGCRTENATTHPFECATDAALHAADDANPFDHLPPEVADAYRQIAGEAAAVVESVEGACQSTYLVHPTLYAVTYPMLTWCDDVAPFIQTLGRLPDERTTEWYEDVVRDGGVLAVRIWSGATYYCYLAPGPAQAYICWFPIVAISSASALLTDLPYMNCDDVARKAGLDDCDVPPGGCAMPPDGSECLVGWVDDEVGCSAPPAGTDCFVSRAEGVLDDAVMAVHDQVCSKASQLWQTCSPIRSDECRGSGYSLEFDPMRCAERIPP